MLLAVLGASGPDSSGSRAHQGAPADPGLVAVPSARAVIEADRADAEPNRQPGLSGGLQGGAAVTPRVDHFQDDEVYARFSQQFSLLPEVSQARKAGILRP